MQDPVVTIRRQNRRDMMIRPVPGGIEVFIPHWIKPESAEVQTFIRRTLRKLGDDIPPVPAEKLSQMQIMEMVDTWSARLQVAPARLQFREMTRKWGSCSSKGTITLNKRLMWLDAPLAEYVVLHELAHLIELNHSKRFWAILAQHMPDYETRMNDLDAVTRTLW